MLREKHHRTRSDVSYYYVECLVLRNDEQQRTARADRKLSKLRIVMYL